MYPGSVSGSGSRSGTGFGEGSTAEGIRAYTYEKHKNQQCLGVSIITMYQSIEEAQYACNADFDCGIVYDNACDGQADFYGIYNCLNSAAVESSSGSLNLLSSTVILKNYRFPRK